MAKVTMPQLGESVAEGTIGKWLKQPGDHVAKYEPLLEVITDKVNAEVPSPFEGVLKEILAEEGATVPNDAEIAIIETAEDGGGDTASMASAVTPEASPEGMPVLEPRDLDAAAGGDTAAASAPAAGPAGSDETPGRAADALAARATRKAVPSGKD